jgi:hypothetical protein
MESKVLSVGHNNDNRSLSQSCERDEMGMFSLIAKTWPGISIRAIRYSTKTSQSLSILTSAKALIAHTYPVRERILLVYF